MMSNNTDMTVTRGCITVRLLSIQQQAYDEVVAAARTCYSPVGLVDPTSAAAWPDEKRNALVKSIFEAGHHTTLQHSHATFAIQGVSRLAVWSFLHSHPFYNSEQISQRYVAVSPNEMTVPDDLTPHNHALFLQTMEAQTRAYTMLCTVLAPDAAAAYLALFPGRADTTRAARDVERRSQEVARYVLPLATHACLHHTVSVLTILRYHKMMNQPDAPAEQRNLAEAMLELLLRVEPNFAPLVKRPFETAEFRFAESGEIINTGRAAKFTAEFDTAMDGRKFSKLIGDATANEPLLADSVRTVLGISSAEMNDDEAIEIALNPERNKTHGEIMNLSTMAKLAHPLWHPHYTFRKKLSHCADSQNQRHRMTPASRPVLMAHYTGAPDVVAPQMIAKNAKALEMFHDINALTWHNINTLLHSGATPEQAALLLPNATAVRFTESADLLNLRHKMTMRLCNNAQEEIVLASYEEAEQITAANPRIGQHLSAPCVTRQRAGTTPPCPEGERFCGKRQWPVSNNH